MLAILPPRCAFKGKHRFLADFDHVDHLAKETTDSKGAEGRLTFCNNHGYLALFSR